MQGAHLYLYNSHFVSDWSRCPFVVSLVEEELVESRARSVADRVERSGGRGPLFVQRPILLDRDLLVPLFRSLHIPPSLLSLSLLTAARLVFVVKKV